MTSIIIYISVQTNKDPQTDAGDNQKECTLRCQYLKTGSSTLYEINT